eukprot:CAMPEP_0113709060 /NCGR_PEP_ID=MMETSP0038_2-20120614/29343_1 /TAXON_ID=2898 /ORGANISM="Cryptomonas paramecium" /LENGTH=127 /DNA_ID=CAMNT_0000634867 /DNA_START=5 /DNA_END=388 /DNA_ORIENTATION=+ /assembly_acc=CAM_ASM_000170
MFGTARDFHDMAQHFQTLHLQSAGGVHEHHFQELKGNAEHAGVVGHGGKGGFPRPFGGNFKKGYLWYDNQVFWDHSFSYDSSNFQNPVSVDHTEKSHDPNARWGWVMRSKKKGKKIVGDHDYMEAFA